jgi:hypothetical protein
MNLLLHTLSDPIWPVLAVAIILTTPLLIVAVRTEPVMCMPQCSTGR